MSQFCGSFAALINRSLLTVILYCAAGSLAVSTVIDTPAIAAQAMVTSLRLRYCMTAPSHEAARALRSPRCGRHSTDRTENSIPEAPMGQRRVRRHDDILFAPGKKISGFDSRAA